MRPYSVWSLRRKRAARKNFIFGGLSKRRISFMESCLPPYGNTLDELSVEGDWNENENVD